MSINHAAVWMSYAAAPRSSFPAPASPRRLLTRCSRLFRRPFCCCPISVGSSSVDQGLTADTPFQLNLTVCS
jgi:hypothetical protein